VPRRCAASSLTTRAEPRLSTLVLLFDSQGTCHTVTVAARLASLGRGCPLDACAPLRGRFFEPTRALTRGGRRQEWSCGLAYTGRFVRYLKKPTLKSACAPLGGAPCGLYGEWECTRCTGVRGGRSLWCWQASVPHGRTRSSRSPSSDPRASARSAAATAAVTLPVRHRARRARAAPSAASASPHTSA